MKKGTASGSRISKSAFKVQEHERPGITHDEVQQIKEAFDLFDPEYTGYVSPQELKASLDSLGNDSKNQAIYHMISDIVDEGNSHIDFDQFLDLMTARVSTKDSRQDMKKIFNLFDEEKCGFISLKTLKKVIKDLGENIDEHELQQMIEKADLDKDGLVSEEQFYNIMTKKNRVTA